MSVVYGETKGVINVMEQGAPFKRPQYKQIAWNANYDGDIANIDFATNDNGIYDVQHMRLDNSDIMRMLSVQPVNMPLENRLIRDFGATDLMPLEGVMKPKRHKTKRVKHGRKKGSGFKRKSYKLRR